MKWCYKYSFLRNLFFLVTFLNLFDIFDLHFLQENAIR